MIFVDREVKRGKWNRINFVANYDPFQSARFKVRALFNVAEKRFPRNHHKAVLKGFSTAF